MKESAYFQTSQLAVVTLAAILPMETKCQGTADLYVNAMMMSLAMPPTTTTMTTLS